MIYIVTGTQRSGTSMLMGCLKAGGLTPYYSEGKEKILREKHPGTNKGGYFEPELSEMDDLNFPQSAEGKVVKFHAPWKMIGTIKPAQYKIIFILRDPREIVYSMCQFNGGFITSGDLKIFNNYQDYINKGIELAKNRRDVESIDVVEYRDVLAEPLKFFEQLDWPIDPVKAANEVNPDAMQSPYFDFPFSGDIAKDLKLGEPIPVSQALVEGKLNAPPEFVEAAKKGAQFGLQAT